MHPWLPAVPPLLSIHSLGLHRHAALPPARLLPLTRTAGGLLAAPGRCSLLRTSKQYSAPEVVLHQTKRLPGTHIDKRKIACSALLNEVTLSFVLLPTLTATAQSKLLSPPHDSKKTCDLPQICRKSV